MRAYSTAIQPGRKILKETWHQQHSKPSQLQGLRTCRDLLQAIGYVQQQSVESTGCFVQCAGRNSSAFWQKPKPKPKPDETQTKPFTFTIFFPECQRNVSKRQTHPFQYQDHEILEFRGTFTAFLSDLDRRSIIMYMLGLSTLANISQLSPCILLWSTTCTPWTAAGNPVAHGSRHIDKNASVNAQIIKND